MYGRVAVVTGPELTLVWVLETDRLREQSSYNPTSHKATPLRTLTRRAQLVRVA